MEPIKISLEKLLIDNGFKQTGTENGVPIFEPELTEDQIDQNDELFIDYK